jgi:hypothetical protein
MSTPTRATPAPPRPGPVRPLIGAVFVVATACLIALAAFNVVRSPSECGGDGWNPCPGGFVPSIIAVMIAMFTIAPLGIVWLQRALRSAFALAGALGFGGATAGFYVAGFVAEPVTDSTIQYWLTTIVFGVLTLPWLWATLRTSTGPPKAAAPPPPWLADPKPTPTAVATEAAARVVPKATAGTAPKAPAQTGVSELRDLLSHGLTSGQLGQDGRTGSSSRVRVGQLVDLHRRGVIDDATLRAGIEALRSDSAGSTS